MTLFNIFIKRKLLINKQIEYTKHLLEIISRLYL